MSSLKPAYKLKSKDSPTAATASDGVRVPIGEGSSVPATKFQQGPTRDSVHHPEFEQSKPQFGLNKERQKTQLPYPKTVKVVSLMSLLKMAKNSHPTPRALLPRAQI